MRARSWPNTTHASGSVNASRSTGARAIARATPVIGDEFAFVFFGGFQLGPNALLRFYVLHVVGLPLTVGFLIAIHFWRIRKDGGITGPL